MTASVCLLLIIGHASFNFVLSTPPAARFFEMPFVEFLADENDLNSQQNFPKLEGPSEKQQSQHVQIRSDITGFLGILQSEPKAPQFMPLRQEPSHLRSEKVRRNCEYHIQPFSCPHPLNEGKPAPGTKRD